MRAVFYEAHSGPEVLQTGDRPKPGINADQVLVQVAAASVNPIGRRLRAGELSTYIKREFPVIPGWDFAGRIIELGDNVSNWQKGDEWVNPKR